MKAIILAAGEGKRLRPLTEHVPKSLVQIWGQSLLERQLNQLQKSGIDDIQIVTGYKKQAIDALGYETVFNSDYNSTNMVHSLSQCLPVLRQSTAAQTLILYGDIAYTDNHLQSLINATATEPLIVLGNTDWYELWAQRLDDPLTDAETFKFDQQFKLTDIGKRPQSISEVQAQYMGMIKVDTPYLIELLEAYTFQAQDSDSVRNMYMTDLIQQVAERQKAKVELVSGSWIEIDTIEDYNLYAQKQACDFGL